VPTKIPDAAGKPYQPSNGAEGELFMEQFCYRCKHDAKFQDDDDAWDAGCTIIMLTMTFSPKDPEYPKEWIRNKDGVPVCTKFNPKAI